MYILMFMIGAIGASFTNCVAYRIEKEKKWWNGRSECESCGHILKWYDLIPVISYVMCKGKCRYCHKPIDAKHVYTEIVVGLCSMAIYWKRGTIDEVTIVSFLFGICLYGLSIVDYALYIIPDTYVWIAFGVWAISSWNTSNFLQALLMGFILWMIDMMTYLIWHKVGMGLGDIKLLFVTCLYVGWYLNVWNVLIACIFALLYAWFTKKTTIAFGPCISISTFLIVLYLI